MFVRIGMICTGTRTQTFTFGISVRCTRLPLAQESAVEAEESSESRQYRAQMTCHLR